MGQHGTDMRIDREGRLAEIPSPTAGIRSEDYLTYRPYLFRVLGRLARDGYAVPPDDGLDLVHDFFVEAWSGVVERYDSEKAQFPTYLHLSFASFARPRIVKLTRWRTTLIDPHDFPRLHGPTEFAEPYQERSSDAFLVEAAVKSMARQDRIIFNFYIQGTGSERQIAHRLGITRYRLRSKLADLFGSVAVKLGDLSAFPEPDLAIVVALWRDHRTAKEAASYLKLTVPEIQAVRTRMFRLLSETVKGSGDMDYMEFMRKQETDIAPASDIATLLQRAAAESSEARDQALGEIRRNAASILAYLEGLDARIELSPTDAATYARIYAALSEEEDWEALREAELPYVLAYESQEVLIGQAFRQALIPGLPGRLSDLSTYFLGLKVVDPVTRDYLQTNPTVTNGGPAARELSVYGLTPATLVTAAYAVASLVRRKADDWELSLGAAIRLGDSATADQPAVSLDEAYEQVALVAELDREAARRVTRWLLETAGFVPLMFDDFAAEPHGDGLTLRLTDEVEDDFLVRWRAMSLMDDGQVASLSQAS